MIGREVNFQLGFETATASSNESETGVCADAVDVRECCLANSGETGDRVSVLGVVDNEDRVVRDRRTEDRRGGGDDFFTFDFDDEVGRFGSGRWPNDDGSCALADVDLKNFEVDLAC